MAADTARRSEDFKQITTAGLPAGYEVGRQPGATEFDAGKSASEWTVLPTRGYIEGTGALVGDRSRARAPPPRQCDTMVGSYLLMDSALAAVPAMGL